MKNPEYEKDIRRLEKMSISKNVDVNVYDLFSLTFLEKKMTIPRSTRGGFVSKVMNMFFVKLYYVVFKMFEPVLNTQERFNRSILQELVKVKEELGIKNTEQFPYADFQEKFWPPEAEVRKNFDKFSQFIAGKKRIVDLWSGKGEFLRFAKEQGVKEIYGFEEDGNLLTYADTDAFEIEHKDIIDSLTDHNLKEFDVVTMLDVAEYVPLNYLVTVIREVKRVLKEDGYFIVRTYNPEVVENITHNFDPKFNKYLHKTLLRFLLEYFGFINIQEITLDDEPNKYAISAQKP
ncbi:methyltransferase domain-containing protein [Candidatus Dojkabacteria bacterium]|uniref:Methyltransferase domain-containing protein n=1 Tax=Candidatus Dojkabacteria bacterium TaxID=2099670 RepID=A0A955L733_9BACT|nr:methyltransferase domain-containing protein [Candidatus Dojkabacteria bacterium]